MDSDLDRDTRTEPTPADLALVPLTGLAFTVLVIIGFTIAGDTPEVGKASAEEIKAFYVDNSGRLIGSGAVEAIAATLLVFFGACLRRALRAAERSGHTGSGVLPAVAFAGAVIFATGLALDATITFALAETAKDIDPVATQALFALYQNDFLVFAVGLQLLMLGTGLAVLRSGGLPSWVGWAAVVIGVIAATPIGFAGFVGGIVLIGVMGVLLTLRARAASTPSVG